jgi:hypothetical protein
MAYHIALDGRVLAVQVIPSALVAAAVPATLLGAFDIATKVLFPKATAFHICVDGRVLVVHVTPLVVVAALVVPVPPRP